MKCLCCDSKDLEGVILKGLSSFRCLDCKVEFVWPQPTDEELRNFYRKDYYKSWGVQKNSEDIPTEIAKNKKITFESYLNIVENKLGSIKGCRILDIGCAFGDLLDAAKERGSNVYGIELSDFGAGKAKDKFGSDRIFYGRLEDSHYPDNYFDFIFMLDLIEHTKTPKETMEIANRILKTGGYVILVTPDTDSLSRKIMGRRWINYKPVEHNFYFNKKSLSNLADKIGFSLLYKKMALKYVTMFYFNSQLQYYKVPMFSLFVKLLGFVIPSKAVLPILSGDMFVIFKKTNDCVKKT